ncbi:ABC transporter permease [Chloroflexota bacterium]
MVELWHGLVKAIELIVSLDPEVMQIAGRSLRLAATSAVLASLICLPISSLIHFNRFPGKNFLISLIQTLYAVPTVAIGLFVFVFISRAGPLGSFGLLFTPGAIIIGQIILISPILLGLTISALKGVDKAITDTARSLGASGLQTAVLVIKEARFAVMAAIIMGFGRALSEVGVSLMIGGNIRGFTRVITTAISLETSKGDIELSLALGIILIFLALLANIIMSRIQQR